MVARLGVLPLRPIQPGMLGVSVVRGSTRKRSNCDLSNQPSNL